MVASRMGRQSRGLPATSPASGPSPGAAPVRLFPRIRAKESTLVILFTFYPPGIRDHLYKWFYGNITVLQIKGTL